MVLQGPSLEGLKQSQDCVCLRNVRLRNRRNKGEYLYLIFICSKICKKLCELNDLFYFFLLNFTVFFVYRFQTLENTLVRLTINGARQNAPSILKLLIVLMVNRLSLPPTFRVWIISRMVPLLTLSALSFLSETPT